MTNPVQLNSKGQKQKFVLPELGNWVTLEFEVQSLNSRIKPKALNQKLWTKSLNQN